MDIPTSKQAAAETQGTGGQLGPKAPAELYCDCSVWLAARLAAEKRAHTYVVNVVGEVVVKVVVVIAVDMIV